MLHIVYYFAMIILITGLFIMITSDNYLRKLIGLSIFQSSVLVFYISLGKIKDGIVPIDICKQGDTCSYIYTNPLPHVLMLTAIVVGFSTLAVGFAFIYGIYKEYGTLSETKINHIRIKD